MSIPILLFLFALVLALISEFQAQGKSITGWAVVFLALGLLWGQFG